MATEERIRLTPNGKAELEQEHELLRSTKRPDLLRRVQELTADAEPSAHRT